MLLYRSFKIKPKLLIKLWATLHSKHNLIKVQEITNREYHSSYSDIATALQAI